MIDAVVVAAARTPIGRAPKGMFRTTRPDVDDLRARHHHLLDEGVAQFEDRVDHLAFLGLDLVGPFRHVDVLAQLALRGEGAVVLPLVPVTPTKVISCEGFW